MYYTSKYLIDRKYYEKSFSSPYKSNFIRSFFFFFLYIRFKAVLHLYAFLAKVS